LTTALNIGVALYQLSECILFYKKLHANMGIMDFLFRKAFLSSYDNGTFPCLLLRCLIFSILERTLFALLAKIPYIPLCSFLVSFQPLYWPR